MLSESEFAEQQRVLGCRIHEHDGEFWEETYPFYCRPAFAYKPFERGTVRPCFFNSLLGYSHQVHNYADANSSVSFLVLDRDSLDNYGILKLPPKKRNKVRRALENCVIQPIADIDIYLERMREINISQSLRQEQGFGAETPVSRYTDEANKWRAQIRRDFSLKGREWWGAFVDGQLVAYLRTYQVEDIRVIQQTKSDTAYFKEHAMDALYYTVLLQASADASCKRIVNGGPSHSSLNQFKEQFLFRVANYPYYSSNACLVKMVKKLMYKKSRQTILITQAKDDCRTC